eukprot:TRINITY_DN6413_c0_g1_i2.p1 TRINITY_DN6413_c0_g1~~TRINITY_DN6413_c0_g1_i2.p1  ORF type:complete len:701 (+),score=86.88 TRINITY_DN6413_c0_g1_i2:66-2105(+)
MSAASCSLEACGFLVILVVNGICLVVYSVSLVWSVLTTFQWRDPVAFGVAVFSEWLNLVTLWQRDSHADPKEDAFEKKVAQLADFARIKRCKTAAKMLRHVLAAFSLMLFFGFGFYDLDKLEDESVVYAEFHQNNLTSLVLGFLMTLCLHFWRDHVNSLTFDVFHCLCLGRIVWQDAACPDVFALLERQTATTASRIGLAVLFGTPKVSLSIGVLCSLVKGERYYVLFSSLSPSDQQVAETVHGSYLSILIAELFVCALTWWSSSVVQTCSLTSERSRLEARVASTSEGTIKSLLAVLCDAVMVVDEHLVLTAPSPSLAHLLRCEEPAESSRTKANLVQFVPPADRARVMQQVVSSATVPGTTISVATVLTGSGNYSKDVRMYCVSFLDIYDRPGYVIGVVDGKEPVDSYGQQQLAEDAIQALRNHHGVFLGSPAGEARNAPGSSSVGSTSMESTSVPLLPDGYDPSAAEAWLDIGRRTMPVLQATPGMTQIVGPLEPGKSTLFDWLQEDEAGALICNMMDAYHAYADAAKDDPGATAQARLGRVRLRPLHALRAGLQYRADITMEMAENPAAQEHEERGLSEFEENGGGLLQIPVRLCFENIGMKKASRRCRSAPAMPGRASGLPTMRDEAEHKTPVTRRDNALRASRLPTRDEAEHKTPVMRRDDALRSVPNLMVQL